MKLNGGSKLFATVTTLILIGHFLLDYYIDNYIDNRSTLSFMEHMVVESLILAIFVSGVLYITCYLPMHKSIKSTKALRSTDESLKLVLESSGVIMWAVNQNGICTMSMGSGLRKIGLEDNELVGVSSKNILPTTKSDVLVQHALNGVFSVHTYEFTPGTWFKSYYIPVDGQGAVGIAMDVTREMNDKSNMSEIRKIVRESQDG